MPTLGDEGPAVSEVSAPVAEDATGHVRQAYPSAMSLPSAEADGTKSVHPSICAADAGSSSYA
jgi:hypothetical protein